MVALWGENIPPSYADIYLADWYVARYLYYISVILTTSLGCVGTLAVLNFHHPQIKPKHNLQLKEVEFLDTHIFSWAHRTDRTAGVSTSKRPTGLRCYTKVATTLDTPSGV